MTKFSVIVPAYNAETTLPTLLESLKKQTFGNFEVIVIDDCSQDGTAAVARRFDCQLFSLNRNRGPAFSRNFGAKKATGKILVFTDSDCCVDPNWLLNMDAHFSRYPLLTKAIMGQLKIYPSNLLGNSISALGFPAGGSIGFEKIWKVDANGFTMSLSTCNCAIQSEAFWRAGAFDTSFPYAGGEDSLLAYNLLKADYKIKYCPDVLVHHIARDSFIDFLKWHFRRGISSYIFTTKITDKRKFYSLRLWSTINIVKYNYLKKEFPLILTFLGFSYCMQIIGFLHEKYRRDINESFNN